MKAEEKKKKEEVKAEEKKKKDEKKSLQENKVWYLCTLCVGSCLVLHCVSKNLGHAHYAS